MSSFVVSRVRSDQWTAWRDARLRALVDSPSAYSSTLEVEAAYDDELWIGRSTTGEAGVMSANFAAVHLDHPTEFVGMVAVITAAVSKHCAPRHAELVSMWTEPAARGHGIGQQLVGACIDWASAATEIDALNLWVTVGNDPALRLYERCGFTRTGEQQPLPSNASKDEIRMSHGL